MPDHHEIPRGLRASHPPGYVQATDPGAVGAFRPWWVTDDDDAPTSIVDFCIRNADDTDWISYGDFIAATYSAPVVSVFGRIGAVVAAAGDYSIGQLSDVDDTGVGAGHFLRFDGSGWVPSNILDGDLGSGTPDNTKFLRGDRAWAVPTADPIADGDYGDIVISGSGTVWTVQAGVIDSTKLGGDITAAGILMITAANAAAQRTLLSLGALALLNTVAAAQIDSDAVTTAKILNANVTGAKLENNIAIPGSPTTTSQSASDDSTKVCTTATAHDIVDAALSVQEECVMVAVSDETTAITTGDAKITFFFPWKFTVTSVIATLSTQSSSGAVTIDVNEAGTTIFSTKITIDANEDTSDTAATAAVISDANIARLAKMTVDIDGAGTGAKGLKLHFYGVRAL